MIRRILYYSLSLVLLLGLARCTVTETATTPTAADKVKSITPEADPSLVGWWKFDETSGTTAADSSKHARHGKLIGGLSFNNDSVSGRVGNALKLGGRDRYVQITGYKGITGTQARTVAAWIKTTSSRGEILSWGLQDFGKMFIFGFVRGRRRIGVTPHGGYLYINAESHDDEWHHVVAVVDEAELPNLHDHVRLYMDGTLQEIHDIGLLDLWPIDTGGDLDVRIGRGLSGLIDEVRIYDRALFEEEIEALARGPSSI